MVKLVPVLPPGVGGTKRHCGLHRRPPFEGHPVLCVRTDGSILLLVHRRRLDGPGSDWVRGEVPTVDGLAGHLGVAVERSLRRFDGPAWGGTAVLPELLGVL